MAVMRARRRVLGVALVAVLLALWMLLEFPGLPATAPDGAADPAPGLAVAAGEGAAGGQVASAQPVAPVADDTAPAALDERALVQADHLGGILYAARTAAAAGRFGAACAALDRALALELAPTLEQRRAACEREIARALGERAERVAQLVARGRVVEAVSLVRRLREPRHPRADAAVGAAFAVRHWPDLPRQGPAGGDLPAPAALAANRLVRFERGDVWLEGHALRSHGDGDVTVRVRRGRRIEFAFVARAALEPVDATASEAAEQAIAALHGGDGLLAALWLRYAELAPGDDPRLPELAARSR